MMLRLRLFIAILLVAVGVSYAGTMPVIYPENNTLNFTTENHTEVFSNTAKVMVTINSTVNGDEQNTIYAEALSMLNNAVPGVNWKLSSSNESQTTSGVINSRLEFESRLQQDQIDQLTKALATPVSSNQRTEVKVLGFSPDTSQLNQAKYKLMLSIYQEIQSFVTMFNKKTGSHYFIQSISFNDQEGGQIPEPRVQRYRKDDLDLTLSKEVKLSAYVTLAEKSPVVA
ncbi:MAG: hypothetical protein ACO2ZM_08840 [Francisellaceae bacterium]